MGPRRRCEGPLRHGAVTWWLAALAGHVGSALLAYAIIAVADALGSASAGRVEDDCYASVEGLLDVPLIGKLFVPPVRREADARAGPG
jgi:hypothetical protein